MPPVSDLRRDRPDCSGYLPIVMALMIPACALKMTAFQNRCALQNQIRIRFSGAPFISLCDDLQQTRWPIFRTWIPCVLRCRFPFPQRRCLAALSCFRRTVLLRPWLPRKPASLFDRVVLPSRLLCLACKSAFLCGLSGNSVHGF